MAKLWSTCAPHVMTMMHCLEFKGGYGLHFLIFSFFFSLSLQTDYFVAIFLNL
jgi:hypothetical protein